VTGEWLGPLPHTWTLAIEEQFYLLWPLALIGLLTLTRGRLGWILSFLAGVATLSIGLRFVLFSAGVSWTRVFYGTDTRADALAIGCALAVLFHLGYAWRPRPLTVACAVMLLALWTMFPALDNGTPHWLVGLPMVSAAGAVLIARAATQESGDPLSRRPFTGLGRISYGLYLYHLPVLAAVLSLATLTSVDAGLARGVGLLLAIGISLASYRWVEQPFLRLRTTRGRVSRLGTSRTPA
jgi:peptidoglycan/LPS O-acetylase OafA/YrhL